MENKAQHQKRMSRDHKCILKKQNNNNNNNHDSGKRRKITFIYSRSKLKIFKHFIKKIKAKTQNQKKKDQIWKRNKIKEQIAFQSMMKLKTNLKFTK